MEKCKRQKKQKIHRVGIRRWPNKTRERVLILFLRFPGNMLRHDLSFIWHDYSLLRSGPFEICDI